jgi:hypothetical protein
LPISSLLVTPAQRVRSPPAMAPITSDTFWTRRTIPRAIIRPNAAATSRPMTNTVIVTARADR